MGAYKILKCAALLDGGSIYIDLMNNEGNKAVVKLDKEIGSPTEGKVFATMLNNNQPLSKKEEKVLLEILINIDFDTEDQKWHLKIITDYLSGISTQSSDMLSKRNIDDLLQDT